MDIFRVKMKMKSLQVAVVLLIYFSLSTEAHNTEYVMDTQGFSDMRPHIVTLDHARQKRAAPDPVPPSPAPTALAAAPTTLAAASASSAAAPTSVAAAPTTNATAPTVADNNTSNVTKPTHAPAVTQVPILGANGTGQKWDNVTNQPKVSDPISADDNITTDAFESPEQINNQYHLGNLSYDEDHDFYNSSFISNMTYFKEHWANITKSQSDVHPMLSNSHRRATTVQLSFQFPFYGNWIQNITVATGGFIFTGEHTHAWLAATQYIAPLMANFDTSLNNDSNVRLSDDGDKFTAFWENVTLRESPDKPFTFAVTLYKNGDIAFAYKNIPIRVQDIDDTAHPVKIGISDAYLTDRVIFYVRRKTIYEYHRVTFKHYEITNNTVLKLTALPTCLQYDTCTGCLNHNTGFDCSWCENIKKCSSGTDRNKQDWQLRNCDKSQVTNASSCPATAPAEKPSDGATYVTDAQSDAHDPVVNTLPTNDTVVKAKSDAENSAFMAPAREPKEEQAHSAIGGAVCAVLAVTLVCSLAAWTLYAFKNPHTRSGQLLIKYRPSQWSWRRGEARYTAATIHM
ncbi:hypothetical protein ABMA28_000048 [Loxostege sticticalis]|uniref:Plexin domain-containing protein 2 n=1 Tax=Loxostege sticticalis TaxID=481309 RepID=A0ABD0TQV7_LOXSC